MRVQVKVPGFAILLKEDPYLKVQIQIERVSFHTLPRDVTKGFKKKVDDFVLKWENVKDLDGRCVKYIRSNHDKPGTEAAIQRCS